MLLGPILPLLARGWRLNDSQAGLLILAQFCGAFLGGISTSARLRRDLAVGLWAAALGLAAFAFAPGLVVGCAGLFVGGFGVGRAITANNIIAGRRFTVNRGAELTRLNFSWSFGALLSPLLAAWLTPRFALRNLLAGFATMFLVAAVTLALQVRGAASEAEVAEEAEGHRGLAAGVFVYFMAVLLVYGGLETCLNAWLTTFALRYGGSSLTLSEYTMVLLLVGLTAGRAVASGVLLKVGETTVIRVALALSAGLASALATAHTGAAIAGFAVLLGLALSPVFPVAFALVMGMRPRARQAGAVMATSGLGAAALPWLMGVVSTRTGSLQVALSIPVAAALILFAMMFVIPTRSDQAHAVPPVRRSDAVARFRL